MQAMLWSPNADGSVSCRLCVHRCRVRKGGKGRCGVRVNLKGGLVSLVNEVVTAVGMDPVEKKPLYHFLPGTKIFSVGSAGCNFHCRFCQNSNISQVPESGVVPGRRVTPEDLVSLAVTNRARSLAFTYNEPTVFFELVYQTARQAKEKGLPSVLVSNGFMSADCLRALHASISAANIDLKGFSDEFYRSYCGGRLQPVLDNLKAIKAMGWWLEVTTLVIPGVNDTIDELKGVATFIHDELGADTPWHISAFHGAYRMADYPATPLPKLEEAWRIGRESGLHYVYIGNVRSAVGSTTFCSQCGAAVIRREGFEARVSGALGECPSCGTVLPGIWTL
ncbi:MAG: AmmeMemoRadiSam system radical SAM enzyme [Desulfovibrio sp.]|nr:AmmeMemoRadiSam system radical SAM enzyme [Desulfovibrio sp.]